MSRKIGNKKSVAVGKILIVAATLVLLPFLLVIAAKTTSFYSRASIDDNTVYLQDNCSDYDDWLHSDYVQDDHLPWAIMPSRTSTKGHNIKYVFGSPSTSLKFHMMKGPDQGKIRVNIDGNDFGVVDLYSPTKLYGYELVYSNLPNTRHRLSLTVTGDKNLASSGQGVTFESVYDPQYQKDILFCVDNTNLYQFNSWEPMVDSNAFDGSYYTSSTGGATVSAKAPVASTNYVGFMTAKGPSYGIVEFYVDGQLAKTIDLYSPTQVWQHEELVYMPAKGFHIPSIKVTGNKNPNSTGSAVVYEMFIFDDTPTP